MKAVLTAFASTTLLIVASGCTPKATKTEAKSTAPAPEADMVPSAVGESIPLPPMDVSECGALAKDPADKRDFVFNARLRTGKKVKEALAKNEKPPCIKNDVHRPITFLSADQVKDFTPDWMAAFNAGTHAVIANVSHIDPTDADFWANPAEGSKRAFWFAKVPLTKVSTTYFQLEHFPSFAPDFVNNVTGKIPEALGLREAGKTLFKIGNDHIAGHTQLRVEFSEDVELVSQFTGRKAATRNLVFTVEAVGEDNYQFDLVSGMGANFVAMHRVTTMEQKFYDMMIAEEGGGRKYHVVEQVNLRIGNVDAKLAEAQAAVVRLFLSYSERNGARIKYGNADEYKAATYNTIANNCTNAITRLIDDAAYAVGAYRGGRGVIASLMKPVDFFPAIVHNGLENRGATVHPEGTPESEVYSYHSMCDDPAMKPMRDKLIEFMKADVAAGKALPEGVSVDKCPTLSTQRPRIVDLFWRARAR